MWDLFICEVLNVEPQLGYCDPFDLVIRDMLDLVCICKHLDLVRCKFFDLFQFTGFRRGSIVVNLSKQEMI